MIVMFIFVLHAKMKTNLSPGYIVAILPLSGIFSGYWIRIGKYGWWRVLIIFISISLSTFILFMAIFIVPKMEQVKEEKSETHRNIKTLDPEVKKMFKAVYVNDLEGVRRQLKKGVDADSYNVTGQTPLHVAQDIRVVKILIKNGANVNAIDDMNMTPIFSKTVDLSEVLVEAGADIHHRSKKGNTPLIFYSYSGYIEGIQYLFSLGANVNAKNTGGQTAFDIAEKFGNINLLKYLKSVNTTAKCFL